MLDESIKNKYIYPIAMALMGKGIYYQNRRDKIVLHQIKTMDKLFIIKDSLINNWNITGEMMKIGKYNCFKAVKNCSTCSSTEEVWFTNQIPVPFGPKGYGGLPGLIVRVVKKGSILQLKSIKYENKNLKINKPNKGEQISMDEYKYRMSSMRINAKKMSH